MPGTIAPDDIVETFAQAKGNDRAPLLVLEPLARFLDAHGIGESGEIRASPIGEGHSNVTYLIERAGAAVVLRRPPAGRCPPARTMSCARHACCRRSPPRPRGCPRCSRSATTRR